MAIQETIAYSHGGGGGSGTVAVETNPGSGRRITLREIVDKHFAENADQVYSHFLFVNRLLRTSGGRFTLSPEILFPLLTDQQPVFRSNKFTLFAEFSSDNRPHFKTEFGDAILTELQRSCDLVDIKGDSRRVFKMKSLGENTPLVILEEKSELDELKYPSLRFVKNTGKVDLSDTTPSEENILTVDIKQRLFLTNDGALNWINAGSADWMSDEKEPYVFLTEEALQVLSQPLNIYNEIYHTPRDFFHDHEYFLMKEVFPNPNFELVNFPIYIPGRTEERYVRPYYYLDLVLLGAQMTQLSVLSNKDSSETIAYEAKDAFRDEMFEFQNALFMIEFDNKVDNGNLSHSPIEYLMYELLWRGVDIWPYMDEFTDSMIQSFKASPERFWNTVSALGLDQVFPVFHGLDETRKEELKRKLRPDSELAILRRVFSLIPSLTPYYYEYNQDKDKRYKQSDEYYMQIALALAAYSHDVGQEQVAAIAVHDGKVIGARRNDTKRRDEKDFSRILTDHSRHAEILLINSLGDALKPGTKLYVLLTPCDICTYHIRRNPNIGEVNCSLGSYSGDIKSLTNPHLGKIKRDDNIAEEPPLVRMGILEDVARNFYIRTNWTKMPIYNGTGVRVIDNRGKQHYRYLIIPGGTPLQDKIIKEMIEDEK